MPDIDLMRAASSWHPPPHHRILAIFPVRDFVIVATDHSIYQLIEIPDSPIGFYVQMIVNF